MSVSASHAFAPAACADEHSQTDGPTYETDGFTYAIDEDGGFLWFISLGVYYRGRREAEAAEPPAEPEV